MTELEMEFERKWSDILNYMAALKKVRDEVDAQYSGLKEAIYKDMEKQGLPCYEGEKVSIKMFPPCAYQTIDSKKLKKEYPDVAKAVTKMSPRAGYIKFAAR